MLKNVTDKQISSKTTGSSTPNLFSATKSATKSVAGKHISSKKRKYVLVPLKKLPKDGNLDPEISEGFARDGAIWRGRLPHDF